jgi:hypothetical protein
MVAGADSIDDMALLRHGGMGRVFAKAYAPSTLGSFLRAFTFGHVRQLDAVATRFLSALVGLTRLLGPGAGPGPGTDCDDAGPSTRSYALLDVDDTIVEVHGHAKQGAGFGYTRVRGLNALCHASYGQVDALSRCVSTLRFLKHRDLNLPWDQHDWTDMWALSVAIPYRDVVVTEKRWAHLATSGGLGSRYGTSVTSGRHAIEAELELVGIE